MYCVAMLPTSGSAGKEAESGVSQHQHPFLFQVGEERSVWFKECAERRALEKLPPHIQGNVGFVFTKEDLTEIRDMLLAIKALGIIIELSKGTTDILNDVQLIKAGDQLGASVRHVAGVHLQTSYPAVASGPPSIISGHQRVLPLSVATDFTSPLAEKVKAFLAVPSAFAAADLVAASTPTAAPAKGEAEEESQELDEDVGFGL
ncbi:60S acidic ribosomal protein P0 [Camelus dromedarius]|uniref:Large ribosomal subunit protein uL10 n=1 Tax=Camelus dromedarius TaxID=9838 RepID=A0A5N4EIE6_CAMDR|nr:60S acidic ribosomal protein P0 [Camelus dromedarius]